MFSIVHVHFRWMSNLDGKPGFNRQILNALREKHLSDPWQYTLCSVMVDSMAIKNHIEWDQNAGSMTGFVNLELSSVQDTDSDEVAPEAVVILAVGLLGHWKAPIAYFLTSKLAATLQGELLRQAIIELESVGLSTVALVMDGLAANVRMVKDFGCTLDVDNISPFFPNPVDPSKQIAVVFDACHMLKLMRNTLHCYKAISLPGKGIARFHHFRLLNDTQKEGLRAANRLTTRHIDFV